MNLFELLNNFWRVDEQESFTGNETRLYFFLLYLANRAYWAEWFEYADSKMMVNMGFSTQVLRTAKQKLKEAKLIDYTAGGGYRCKAKYQILTPKLAPRLPDYIKTKDINTNTKTYGKKKVLSIQEVISTKGSFYDMLKSDIEEKLSREKKKIELFELPLPISFAEFCDLFVAFGTHTLLLQNQKIVFEMDEYNEPIIEQLFFFLTRDSQFQGDLNKGILLQGKFGCGKTVIMETFAEIHNHIVKRMGIKRPLITFIKSLDLQEKLITQSTTSFVYRPLIIDEFGREPKIVQDYGNYMRPISELLSLRSDNGSITHGITNFSFERLVTETYYGAMIGDRLKMMFNLMPMKGDSKRK